MNAEARATVQVKHRFTASSERVFDAWLDPNRAGKWLFATPTGQMVRVEIDPRVGGKFKFIDRREGEDIDHIGEYLEIDRPRRLAFTFAVPKYSKEFTRVMIDIVPAGGGCELTLTQTGVLPEWAKPSESGWGTILSALAKSLS
jgi:uncharacterized protein YndB with AHSA1/START domain